MMATLLPADSFALTSRTTLTCRYVLSGALKLTVYVKFLLSHKVCDIHKQIEKSACITPITSVRFTARLRKAVQALQVGYRSHKALQHLAHRILRLVEQMDLHGTGTAKCCAGTVHNAVRLFPLLQN